MSAANHSKDLTKHVGKLVVGGVMTLPKSTVTQATSITTGVTATGSSGVITTVSSTLAAVTATSFTVTNVDILATSVINVNLCNYAGTYQTNGVPVVSVGTVAAGSFVIHINNVHASNALSGIMKISWVAV